MNIVQIQSRVQELPNSPQTMQYLNAAMNGQVTTVPPYIAAAELKRRETEGMMDQLAKGAAQAPQATVKDQLQQKMGIMALMGQQQPPQPPQIPQPAPPEQQPQAGGIDSLPVKEDMFGMAGGGIVAFNGEKESVVPEPYETGYDRMIRLNREETERRIREAEEAGIRAAADPNRPAMRRLVESDRPDMERKRRLQQEAQMNVRLAQQGAQVDPRMVGITPPEETVGTMGARPGTLRTAPPPGQKPPGPRPPAAARPPAEAGISLADLNPGASPNPQEDALFASAEFQRMKQLAGAQNPYGGPQESREDYIRRMTEGIRSQMPGGKMPYETSEARLKEIEARRAKEDTEYADSNKGRQLDNLLTMISGMGRGSFGNAGAQGIQAVQKVERSQREEDLKRKDMRDQQNMKLMEIRTLNDQAQMALAQGNVQAYEKLTQEAKKLKIDFDTTQASLNKDVATLGAGARGRDVEAAANERKLREESRQKQLGRESDERIARTRTAGRGEMTAAQAAKLRADATKALDKYLENAPYKERLAAKDPAERERLLQQRMDSIFQSGQGYTSGSPPPKPGGGAAPAGFTVQRDPK